MMPANRAVSSGSPFFVRPARTCRTAPADMWICASATASRAVGALSPTSTMRMRPRGSTCESPCVFVRLRIVGTVALRQEERQALERHGQVHAFELDAARDFDRAGREIENSLHAGRDHCVD